MTAHTPGPWKPESYGSMSIIVDRDGTEIAETGYDDNKTAVANAHLMAAAPDLLHNLVGLTTVVEAMATSGEMFEPQQLRRVIDLARAAIAKAEGDKP